MALCLPYSGAFCYAGKQIKKGWHTLPTLVDGERTALFFSPNSFYIYSIFATLYLIYIGEMRNSFNRDMHQS